MLQYLDTFSNVGSSLTFCETVSECRDKDMWTTARAGIGPVLRARKKTKTTKADRSRVGHSRQGPGHNPAHPVDRERLHVHGLCAGVPNFLPPNGRHNTFFRPTAGQELCASYQKRGVKSHVQYYVRSGRHNCVRRRFIEVDHEVGVSWMTLSVVCVRNIVRSASTVDSLHTDVFQVVLPHRNLLGLAI